MEKKDILKSRATVYYKAENVLVDKETGEYYIQGKYGSLFFIGQRKLTEEELEYL